MAPRVARILLLFCAGRVRGANSYAYDSSSTSPAAGDGAASYASYGGEAEDTSLDALVVNTAVCTAWCNFGDKAMCNYDPCETCLHDPESVCYEELVEDDTGGEQPGCAPWCKKAICDHPECTE